MVRVARRGDLTVAEVAADFDISVESVRRWVRQAEIDEGVRNGLTSAEQAEVVQLRRDKRQLEMETRSSDARRRTSPKMSSQSDVPARPGAGR